MTNRSEQDLPSRIVELIKMARGGVIYDSKVATRLGELLLEVHYGQSELDRQRPLLVEDKGDYWRVEGSWNRDRKIEGNGAFFLSVKKFDGCVTDLGVWGIVHPHPSVKGIIEAHLGETQKKPENGE